MTKPTIEEVEKARQNIQFIGGCIANCNEKILKLIDQLTAEKAMLNDYQDLIIQNKKIIYTYEAYEQVEAEKEKKAR